MAASIDPHLKLEDAQTKMCTLVNTYRDNLAGGYFTFDGKRWNSDQIGRFNLIGFIILALVNKGQLPPGLVFRDYDNNDHIVSAPYMIGMGMAMMNFFNKTYAASWQHKANIKLLTDPIAVQEYDFLSTLWPDPNK